MTTTVARTGMACVLQAVICDFDLCRLKTGQQNTHLFHSGHAAVILARWLQAGKVFLNGLTSTLEYTPVVT